MKEIWKPVIGYEGVYDVSNMGRVRSLDRVAMRSDGKPCRVTGRLRKTKINGWGYETVVLHEDGTRTSKMVHHLVLEAFSGVRHDDHHGHHIDGNPRNNTVENLEWVPKEAHWSYHNQGHRHHNSRLTPETVRMIRKVIALGEHSYAQIGLMFGTCASNIGHIATRRQWVHLD